MHLQEPAVVHNDARVGVEHAKPLRHVVERGVELELLLAQPLLGLAVGLLQPVPVGGVLVGGDAATVVELAVEDGDDAAVDGLHDAHDRVVGLDLAQDRIGVAAGLAFEDAAREVPGEHLVKRRPGFHFLRRHAVHFHVTPVADREPQVLVEHDEALTHVVDGGVHQPALLADLVLGPALFGDVLLGDDTPPPGSGQFVTDRIRPSPVSMIRLCGSRLWNSRSIMAMCCAASPT